MNLKALICLFILLKAFPSFASKTDTLKLYYNIDKYELSAENKNKIDGLKALTTETSRVEILGYADYLGTSSHNITLSQNRAETVKQYLLAMKNNLVITISGKGAVPGGADKSPDGEPSNRRVDIIYEVKPPPLPPPVAQIPKAVVPEPTPVKRQDTVVVRPKMVVVVDTASTHISFSQRVNNLKNVKIGTSISFEELTFQPGRHFLNQEAVHYLTTILNYMKKHTNITFQILGHICCEVDGRDGQDLDSGGYVLSVNRAKFIYDYFIEQGIDANRMSYKGMASTQHKVFPERSEHDRYLNRRVEFLITGN